MQTLKTNGPGRVLVSDPLAAVGLELLLKHGLTVDVRTGLKPAELIEIIPAYDALLVRSETKVSAAVLGAGKQLKVVARAGVGVDNIDLDAATNLGVLVANAPGGNTISVAEHTVGLLLALARNITQADASLRAGEWKRSRFMGTEVRGKTLGCLGLGRIGAEVARRAQGLAMDVIAYDPYISAEMAAHLNVTLVSLETLVASADFITVHLPLTEETSRMINADALARMKPGVRLINCARGGIIDQAALLAALDSGHVAGAALDVFEKEPLPPDSPLLRHPKVVITPHIAGSTVEAQDQVAVDVAEQVIDVLSGRAARYAVNAPLMAPRDLPFLAPYLNLAERLGRVAVQLGGKNLKSCAITYSGALAEYDLSSVTAAVIKGMLQSVVDVRVNIINAMRLAGQRGLAVSEQKTLRTSQYENMISVQVMNGGGARKVSGALVQDEPHIVGLDDIWVDFPAQGHLLLTRHHDRPGIIGRIGTMLGDADVNISFMHVGRQTPRGEAIMVLGTDEPIPEALYDLVKDVSHTYWVQAIAL